MTHPRVDLDRRIHQPVPLSIVASLSDAEEVAFSVVRDAIGVSDSTLSRHASLLEAAGYVHIRKGHVGKRPRTWLSLTPVGRRALDRHLEALRQIVGQVPADEPRSPRRTRRRTTPTEPVTSRDHPERARLETASSPGRQEP